MNLINCENIYVSCASNCYPNCLDCLDNWILFGSTNSIAIYDLNVRRVITVLYHHSDLVNSIRWIDKNSNYFISSSVDKTNIIWEKINTNDNDNKFIVKFIQNGHEDSVIISDSILLKLSQATSDQQQQLEFLSVSSSTDKCLCLWQNEKLILTENLNYFIFDVKIYQNLLISGIIVLTAGSDNLIHINQFNIESKKFINLIKLKGHKDWIKSIDLIYINEKLMLASASQDFQIRINEIKCLPKPIETIDETNNNINTNNIFIVENEKKQYSVTLESILSGHDGWVTNVKWIHQTDSNRLHLLSSSMDRTIILWEQKQPENDNDVDVGYWNEKIRLGEIGENCLGFLTCSFISSRNFIVGQSFNGAIHIWHKKPSPSSSLSEQQQNYNLWSPYIPITGHFKEVTDLVWEPEGEYFLTCSSDQTTRLHSEWKSDHEESSSSSWHEMARPQIHGYDLKSIAMCGRLKFVSGADEKVIRIFNATKNFISSMQKLSKLQLISNIDNDNGDMNNFAECAIVPTLGLSNSAVYDTQKIDVEFKPCIIDLPPCEEILMQNTLWSESQKLYGHGYEIFSVAVNHNLTLLASACKASNINHASIILWNLKNFKKIQELQSHNLTVTQLRFSPNDHYLLSVSRDRTWSLFGDMLNNLNFINRIAYSDKTIGNIHSRIIWDCAWTPDSKYFLTSSRDKTICTWFLNNLDDQDQEKSLIQIKSQEILTFEQSVTSVDVHENFQQKNKNNCYLMCAGLENGEIFLYNSVFDSESLKIKWIKLYDFNNFRHMSTINRIRFSPKLDKSNESNQIFVYMASASQDKSAKLFKIKIEF